AVRGMGATVAHAHNTLPLIGARGLAAAREAGAKVALTLHNVRLFCATGLGERDGGPCTRCRGRNSLPGLVLNCRRSLPEAVAYATALSVHHPTVLASVDRFVTPSAWAAGRVAFLGLPRERVEVIPHALPASSFADRSHAGEGTYALVLSRLSPEKGTEDAISACAAAGVPLRIAGDGPDRDRLEALAARTGSEVELLGRVSPSRVQELLRGAAAVLVPSHCHEFSPYSALEAMAQGVPVVATAMGGLPEMIGADSCVPLHAKDAFAARLAALWTDPRRREAEGEELIARALANHSEERFTRDLLRLYREIADRDGARPAPGSEIAAG
ncbi:MAG: glycosyltransferase family 4 protein, partial [Actinomycetota bacterium]|nr:glycosyltransferase family 4 protein [Actinomycetota bacterium]